MMFNDILEKGYIMQKSITATTTNKRAHSIKNAAALIDVSVPFLRKEIKAGNLKAKHVSRRVLILDADLEDYLQSKEDFK